MNKTIRKINYLLLILIVAWYIIPIFQERGGMVAIYSLYFLYFLTLIRTKDFFVSFSFLLYLLPFILLLVLHLVLGTRIYGGVATIYFVASILLLFLPFSLYYFKDVYSEREKAILFFLAIVFALVGAINTLIVLARYPEASRALATTKGDIYSKMGAGGFGFSYFLMLFSLLIFSKLKGTKLINKILGLLFILFLCYTIIKCQYATCVLLLIIGITIALLQNAKGIGGIIVTSVVLLLVVAILIDSTNVFTWFANQFKGNEILYKRFSDVANIFKTGDIDSMQNSRSELYMRSINGFLKSPLLGTAGMNELLYGGHSTVLDTLAIYGIVGLSLLIIPFIALFKKIYKQKQLNWAILVSFVLLSILDPTIYIYQLGIVLFFLGPAFSFKSGLQKNQGIEK